MDISNLNIQLDKICRVCLNEGNMLSIFTKSTNEFKNVLLSEMLLFCVSINISENDELPSKICLQCIEELKRSYKFKQRCKNSDELLRSINFAESNVKKEDFKVKKEDSKENEKKKMETSFKQFNNVTNDETIPENKDFVKNLQIYSCTKCNVTFQTLSDLNTHRFTIKHPEQCSHSCSLCEKVFTYSEFLRHVRMHHSIHIKKQLFGCNVCDKKFSQNSSLGRHMKIHASERPTANDEKEKNKMEQFNDNEILPENKVSVKNPQTYECNKCGLTFETLIDLRTHRSAKHPRQHLYNCSICDKAFKYSELLRHMRSHTKEQPFGCNVCDKKFSKNYNLRRHMKIHTNKQPTENDEKEKNKMENSVEQFNDTAGNEILPENKVSVKNPQTYACKKCDLTFETLIDLRTHRSTKHPRQHLYNCSNCDKIFKYSELLRHMRSHTKEQPFGCNVCGKKFSQNGNLLRHIKFHTNKKPAKKREKKEKKVKNSIKQCNDTTDKETTPRKKMQQTNTCKLCNLTFETLDDLKTHRSTVKHSHPRSHSCVICDKAFSTNTQLQHHIRSHTKEQPFGCNVCGKNFSLKSNLWRHMKTHTGERPHKCHLCERAFIQKPTLMDHLRTHNRETSFSCKFCEKRFTQSFQLRVHLRKHSNTETGGAIGTGAIHKCDICQRGFYTKEVLKHHKLTHGEKSLLCSYCGKGFISMAGLKSHSKVHTGERPFSCDFCDKSFRHKHGLMSHILVHTGEKPFICEICSRAFKQKAHLNNHLRIHSGDKRYSCLICGKKFVLNGNLTIHMRIHTGETPHLCPICGKGFYDTSSRKKHMKVHEEQNV